MHLTKIGAYGAGDLLTARVLLSAGADPGDLAGAWVGKRIVGRISDRVFVIRRSGLVVAGVLFLAGF